jgi:pseudouridine-5'-phosphate glycosidase
MNIELSNEVSEAIAGKKPVVALESTVIAHGLPQPINMETAQRMESIVSEGGATPATIGIIDGKLIAGLDHEQLQLMAQQQGIKKVSTRDLPLALAQSWNGATTVASTAWIATRAGIKVFATGGIGGVHRGSLPDISADLPELARTPIVVVCSGAKIVLDLPATREWLETHAVTVIGYQCDEMPAFYSRKSGLPVDAVADSPADVAAIFRAQRELGINSALLVTVPVPVDFEVPSDLLQRTLDTALQEAETSGVSGRELTPFLLSQMAQRSDGATLRANIALLENNARVATAISLALEAE